MNSVWPVVRTSAVSRVRAAAHGCSAVVRTRRRCWRNRIVECACWVAVAWSIGACGDDADLNTGSARSDRKLSALSASDRKAVCAGFIERLDQAFTQPEYERLACTKQALPVSFQVDQNGTLGGNVTLCRRFVGECVQNGGVLGEDAPAHTLGEDLVDADGCEAGTEFQTCDLTVLDFERCTESFAVEVQERLSLASCDALSDADSIEEAFGKDVDPAELPECAAFTTKCRDLTFDRTVDGLK
jgi:hypothetical protein